MDTQNYRRTVAGSVGAGMGAIFNGSGRTYYILEHKTSSKYHQAGESQKIIIDQIELGREASCQVRFDESFSTVSRRHAAIAKEGNNYKLIHLSQSNPTFVNGQPIQEVYYLQSGDEIQLSNGGPRLGFIIPQGRQALTSSIGLTERMNLFRQQALRPYKTAILTLSVLLVLAIAGLGIWNWQIQTDNQVLQQNLVVLTAKTDSLQAERERIEAALRDNSENEELKARLADVDKELQTMKDRVVYMRQQVAASQSKRTEEEEMQVASPKEEQSSANPVADSEMPVSDEMSASTASTDLKDYYKYMYVLKVQGITVSKGNASFSPNDINIENIICGNGFLLENGTFVTARQNIEPWVFSGDIKDDWRKILAEYVGAGCTVKVSYKAYNVEGTAHPIEFSSDEFTIDRSDDLIETYIMVRKAIRVALKEHGIKVTYSSRNTVRISTYSPKSTCWAKLPNKGTAGMPFNASASLSLDGGHEVHTMGYSGNPNIHSLASTIKYWNAKTSFADTSNGTIVMQGANSNAGFFGSPAFIKESDGSFKVVGVLVGHILGEDRIVPISRCQ